MELLVLLGMVVIGIIYTIVYVIPRDIKTNKEKLDILESQLQEIKLQLNRIEEKMDNK